MKRFLIAFLITVLTAIPSAFMVVIPLAILNIYLAGHNITWQDQAVVTIAGEGMDWLDVFLWLGTAAIALSAGVFYLWVTRQREN